METIKSNVTTQANMYINYHHDKLFLLSSDENHDSVYIFDVH